MRYSRLRAHARGPQNKFTTGVTPVRKFTGRPLDRQTLGRQWFAHPVPGKRGSYHQWSLPPHQRSSILHHCHRRTALQPITEQQARDAFRRTIRTAHVNTHKKELMGVVKAQATTTKRSASTVEQQYRWHVLWLLHGRS